MTDKLDIPTSGIKVFDPDNGWSDTADEAALTLPTAPQSANPQEANAVSLESDPLPSRDDGLDGRMVDLAKAFGELPLQGVRFHDDPSAGERQESRESLSRESVEALISSVPSEIDKPELNDQVTALAQVGESLSSFFYALQTPGNLASDLSNRVNPAQPQWRDVADLSRQLEQQVEARQAVLENLSAIEREIRSTREDLMTVLALLADQERKNLEAASLRAQLSAMAANMLAQRFQSTK